MCVLQIKHRGQPPVQLVKARHDVNRHSCQLIFSKFRVYPSEVTWCGSLFYSFKFEDFRQAAAKWQLGLELLPSEHPETLVLYTYSNSDPEYERNMHFFVQYGMAEGDGCEYVIIVQQVSIVMRLLHDGPSCGPPVSSAIVLFEGLQPCTYRRIFVNHKKTGNLG